VREREREDQQEEKFLLSLPAHPFHMPFWTGWPATTTPGIATPLSSRCDSDSRMRGISDSRFSDASTSARPCSFKGKLIPPAKVVGPHPRCIWRAPPPIADDEGAARWQPRLSTPALKPPSAHALGWRVTPVAPCLRHPCRARSAGSRRRRRGFRGTPCCPSRRPPRTPRSAPCRCCRSARSRKGCTTWA